MRRKYQVIIKLFNKCPEKAAKPYEVIMGRGRKIKTNDSRDS